MLELFAVVSLFCIVLKGVDNPRLGLVEELVVRDPRKVEFLLSNHGFVVTE